MVRNDSRCTGLRASHMESRCKELRDMIFAGATTQKLERHFHVGIRALLNSMLKYHYTTQVGKERYFPKLKERLAKNDELALAKKSSATASPQPVIASHTEVEVSSDNDTQPEKEEVTSEDGFTQEEGTSEDGFTQEAVNPTKNVYLLETGSILSHGVDSLLAMDNGRAIFYVPRLCIEELERHSRRLPQAKDALLKIHAQDTFKHRFFPLPKVPEELSMLPRTPMLQLFKNRSLGIVDAAINLVLDFHSGDSIVVTVITSSKEILELLRNVIASEHLENSLRCLFVPARHL